MGLLNAASLWQRDDLQNSGGQPVPETSDPGEGRLSGARVGEKEELLYKGYRVSIWECEKVLEMPSGDGYTAV